MKLEDLDKSESIGKDYYWKMKYERAKMDRKEDVVELPISNVIHGITAVIGLILTILFWLFFPGSILLAVLTGIVWTVSGIARIATGEHLWISAFSFANALFPIISVLM